MRSEPSLDSSPPETEPASPTPVSFSFFGRAGDPAIASWRPFALGIVCTGSAVLISGPKTGLGATGVSQRRVGNGKGSGLRQTR